MIERRQFIMAASGFVFVPASAPSTARVVKVGTLINGGPGPIMEVFKAAFASLGYIEGRGLNFEHRFARGQLDRLPALASELVEVGVDVILASGGPASRAAKGAISTIPIVFSIVTDPLALGLVASMERPGGNVTGITSLDADQADRQLDLLRSVFPKVTRVGILSDDTIPGVDASGLAPIDRANSAAARKLGIQPIVRKVAGGPTPDYAAALDDMLKQGAEALLVLEAPMPLRDGKIVAETAAARRMPSIFPGGQSGTGGLIAYGTSVPTHGPECRCWRIRSSRHTARPNSGRNDYPTRVCREFENGARHRRNHPRTGAEPSRPRDPVAPDKTSPKPLVRVMSTPSDIISAMSGPVPAKSLSASKRRC